MHETADDATPSSGPPPRPEQLLAVLNGLPALVGYWDTEQHNVLANDAYLEWFGRTPEQIRGRHLRDVLGAARYADTLPYVEAALGGEPQLFHRVLVDVSGRPRTVQTSYTPDVCAGVVHGFSVLVTDISSLADAERQLSLDAERYRALARSIPGGFVLLFDADLRFEIVEGEGLATFGHAVGELEGRTIHEVFPARLASELEPRYRAALRGESVTWERRIGDRAFTLTAGPVRSEDGAVSGGTVVAVEVTERQRHEATWAALHEIATTVARGASPQDVAERIALSLRSLLRIDSAAVIRFTSPDTGEIVAMAPDRPPGLSQHLTFTPGESSSVSRVAATGEPARVDYDPAGGGVGAQLRAGGMRTGAAAPIRLPGALWGAVAIATTTAGGITDEVVERLTSFGDLVALAIGNSEAWSELTVQATTDSLTGLPNRRAFDEHLTREVARAIRHQRPLSVVVLDVDHFKAVNDRHGHPGGDRVLVEVARRMMAVRRRHELVYRVGGEEFAWLLPETDVDGAALAAGRIRSAVGEPAFDGVGSLTMSAGVCSLALVDDPADLVRRADEALYQAKRAGRDRCVQYHPAPATA